MSFQNLAKQAAAFSISSASISAANITSINPSIAFDYYYTDPRTLYQCLKRRKPIALRDQREATQIVRSMEQMVDQIDHLLINVRELFEEHLSEIENPELDKSASRILSEINRWTR